MARVFVSHASADLGLAGQVRGWLVEAGHEVFLDHDLRDGIALGEEWERRLHEELRRADAVVCVVTSAFLASRWCTAEVGIARSRGIRLLPLRAEPAVSDPLLGSVQHRDLTTDPDLARAALVEALGQVDTLLDAARQAEDGWPAERSPFPGLRPFEADQHRVFFGRAEEVRQLAELLRSPAEGAEGAALLVVGPSGCGKSSLVRAGLAPTMAGEPGWRVLTPILPGAHPVTALARELAAATRRAGLDWTVEHVRHRLDQHGLTGLADELLLADPAGPQQRLLVVVDQFEELLTQTTPTERVRFAWLLRPALAGPVRVVATLRPEFLDQLLLDPDLAALPTRPYTLRPLHREALRAVIECPARLAGIEMNDGLVDRLLEDTDTGEALPLLAFTLAQLADGVPRGGRLSAARYDQFGGVHGALTHQADQALTEAVAAGGRSREQVINGLLRLVTVDEQGRPTRWRITRPELPDHVATDLDAFVTRRLLSTDADNGTGVIGVTHEAFLSAWPPLAQAIAANVSALRARRAIENAAAEWAGMGHPPTRLWVGGQLAAAVTDTGTRLRTDSIRWLFRKSRMLVTDRVDLSPNARDFLRTSIRHDRFRRKRLTAVLSVLLVGALIAAGIAVDRQRIAEERQRIATARLLLSQAETALEADPQTALQLSIAARRIHRDTETHSILINMLTRTRYAGTLNSGESVTSAALSPDGQILVANSSLFDSAVNLWDFTNQSQPQSLGKIITDHDGGVDSLAFFPHDRTLAIGGSRDANSISGAVTLWDLEDPENPRRIENSLIEHDGPITSFALSPDGSFLATSEQDPTGSEGDVYLWDLADRSRPRRLGEFLTSNTVTSMAFSHGGDILIIEGSEVILWDVTNPTLPRRLGQLPAHASLSSVALSSDGKILAIAENGVILWNFTDPARPRRIGQPIISQEAENNPVGFSAGQDIGGRSMAFSPDDKTLAIGSDSGTTTLWDLSDPATPRLIEPPLTGHTGWVNSVSFSPDGRILITGSNDGTIMLWDLVDRVKPRQVSPPLREPVILGEPVAFSPNGRLLAISKDDAVVLWDITDPTRPRHIGQPLASHDDFLTSVTFSPNGRTLATGSNNDTVVLWDLTNPAQPRRINQSFTNPKIPGESVSFSPDGKILATAASVGDSFVTLWDVTELAHPEPLWRSREGSTTPGAPVAFSSDGRTLATGGESSVILWDVFDPTRPRRLSPALEDHSSFPMFSVTFSPDGRTLATGNHDGSVMLWDIADPAYPERIGQPLTQHEGSEASVAFSPDGRIFATNAEDGTVLMWDLTDSTRPRRLGQPLGFSSFAFSSDGSILATGGFLTLWDLTGLKDLRDHALERACAITRGGLDRNEWERYIPDLPYQDTCPPDGG